jgi:hypothetical protein
VDPSPLVEQALAGSNRQLTLLAARGLLPLARAELIDLQVRLAEGADPEVSRLAGESLAALEPRMLVPVLAQEAGPEVLRWFAGGSGNREVIETLLRRRDVPQDVMMQLAPRLPADLQEILLLRQDRITATPELLEALESNPQLSAYARRRILEYREHLLPSAVSAPIGAPAVPAPADEGEPSEAEVAAAIALARQEAVTADTGDIEEKTGLSEGQIRQLPVPVRLKLARGAPKTLRQFLVRDNSALVALAVVQANPLVDQEVEQYAKMRNVVSEVLEYLGKHRTWSNKYPVALSLVTNPRTPLSVALGLLSRIAVRDLRNIGRDRNLPEAVRSAAARLHRVKSQ